MKKFEASHKSVEKFFVCFAVLMLFLQVFAVEENSDIQACNYAKYENSGEVWKNYLLRYPDGACKFIAIQELKKRGMEPPNNNKSQGLSQDQYDCIDTKKKNTLFAWELYLKEHPNGVCSFEAKIKIAEFKERKEREEEIRRLEIERERKIREAAIKKAENLQWSSLSSKEMTLNDAGKYCRNLSEGGFQDWHVPTIDELRTLIENCPQTVTGGTCKEISSSCSCEKKLPGYYSKFNDEGKLWSSSTAGCYTSRHYGTNCSDWYVDFNSGGFGSSGSSGIAGVRCVRTKTYKDAQYLKRKREMEQRSKAEKEATERSAESYIESPQAASGTSADQATERRAESYIERGKKRGYRMWSDRSYSPMDWNGAKQYCENLSQGGFTDWGLPDIDELRTLIQNHSGTQTGGSCKISEKAGKLSSRDWTNDCSGRSGSKFSQLGDTDWLWSSSVLSDISDHAWVVDFYDGRVGHGSKSVTLSVRCVR